MVNFYHLLGVGAHAPAETIATIIKLKRLQNQIPVEVLDKAEVWLLNSDMRVRYDKKLRQKHPEVFVQPAVALHPSHRVATTQGTKEGIKRRKVGRWYLLGLLLLLWLLWYILTLPALGLRTPESWKSIALTQLQTDASWQQTPQVVYLTEQHATPQWLWVWQKNGQLGLMPVNDDAAPLCALEQPQCTVQIQIDQDAAQTHYFVKAEHMWVLQSPAQSVDLALRLQHMHQMKVLWTEQERPVMFGAASFPSEFLVDAL